MRQPLAATVVKTTCAIEPGVCVLKESAREIIIAADKYGVVSVCELINNYT